MDQQSETTDREPKRRGFFDRPAGVDFWLSVGSRFWGGLLMGLGFGLWIGAWLVEDEVLPKNVPWFFGAWMVLYLIGFAITHRALRRSAAQAAVRSET